MQTYRCYFLNRSHRIIRAEACECADDAGAMCWAEAICRNSGTGYTAVEVWCRDRLLRRCIFSDLSTAATATGDDLRRKAERARARSMRETDKTRRRGLIVIADQYDKLADALDNEPGWTSGDRRTDL